MKMIFKVPLSAALTIALFSGVSVAHEWYVGGQVAWMKQQESDNNGQFDQDFTTGEGSATVPAGTVLPAGTALGWTTEFDDGFAVSGEVGARFDNGLRGGFEVSFTEADVDNHTGVFAGATALDGQDVAVLTGSATPAGATVGQVLSQDDAEVKTTAAFANVYYDFNKGGRVEPYVGAGVGVANVEVSYRPSGVLVTDDDSTRLAWQGKAGATYRLRDNWELFGEYTYRATDDVKVKLDLVPATLKVENEQHMVGVGFRYRFN